MVYENFREVKLRNICSSVSDGDWIETKDQGGKDYRLLQISNIGTGNFVETDKFRWISNKKFEDLQCNEILSGDVLIARMPEPIGRCWWVDKLPWRAITSVDVTIARPLPEEVDGRYLAYYINSPRTLSRINNLATGTTRMRVRRADLADLTIHLPPLKEQKAISNILGTIDKKIELNIKTNKNLENIAKVLFKSWFIDFDPVRAKSEGRSTGLPNEISDLFPSSFEDSELGKIPNSWTTGEINDLIDKTGMGPFGSRIKTETFQKKGVPIIKGGHLKGMFVEGFGPDFLTEEHALELKNSIVKEGDIVLTHRGTLGQVSMVPLDGRVEKYIASQSQFYLRPKSLVQGFYILFFFHSNQGKHRLLENSSGVGVPSLARPSTLTPKIRIMIPEEKLLDHFAKKVITIHKSIQEGLREQEILKSIRDILLPKMISGEISIPDAEKIIEEEGI